MDESTHMNAWCHTDEIWTRHYTHANASRHTHGWIPHMTIPLSTTQMHRVTHRNACLIYECTCALVHASRHTYGNFLTYMKESRHTHECTPHIRMHLHKCMRHVTRVNTTLHTWLLHHTHMNACYTWTCLFTHGYIHTWLHHDTHISEKQDTHMNTRHTWPRHFTCMIASQHTYEYMTQIEQTLHTNRKDTSHK